MIGVPLKRERVKGIAACKSASACWTETELFTWGKNNGQLGYTSPIQPIPRIVTKVMKPVIAVALNVCLTALLICLIFNSSLQDNAMACLLVTQDVVLLFNDVSSRVNFPPPTRLPSDFLAYRPPLAARAVTTSRIFCNESTFATVSSAGEIFTFNPPTSPASNERHPPIQPQRVWTLRKQWSAVHVRYPFRSPLSPETEGVLIGRCPLRGRLARYLHRVRACFRAVTKQWLKVCALFTCNWVAARRCSTRKRHRRLGCHAQTLSASGRDSLGKYSY